MTIVVLSVLWMACVNPPLSGQKGMRPGMTLTYLFVGAWPSPDMRPCVREAIAKWNTAMQANGTGTRLLEATPGRAPSLTFTRATTLRPGVASGTLKSFDGEGYVVGGGIQFTTDANALSSCAGYMKVTLHELGHMAGLADAHYRNGASSMDQLAGKDDAGGNVPRDVTRCDRNRSRTATPNPRERVGAE
jgi:hypothetical protein